MTYPASGNKTDFLSRNGLAGDGRGLSDMLVVASSVRMVAPAGTIRDGCMANGNIHTCS